MRLNTHFLSCGISGYQTSSGRDSCIETSITPSISGCFPLTWMTDYKMILWGESLPLWIQLNLAFWTVLFVCCGQTSRIT